MRLIKDTMLRNFLNPIKSFLNLKLLKEERSIQKIPKRDLSSKPFEVVCKVYIFDKYSREIRNHPEWNHHKYYKTLQGAIDACRDFRFNWSNSGYRDYPSMGNPEDEEKYSHIKPTITVKRYRVVERNPNRSTF